MRQFSLWFIVSDEDRASHERAFEAWRRAENLLSGGLRERLAPDEIAYLYKWATESGHKDA